EVAGQAKLVEDRLALLAGTRLPVGRESIAPPCVRELAQLRDRDRASRIPPTEPAVDVLFRREEIHRASGEDDVVPPVRGGNQAMEHEALVIGPLIAYVERDRLTTIRAGGLDPAARAQCCANPERVPSAVA